MFVSEPIENSTSRETSKNWPTNITQSSVKQHKQHKNSDILHTSKISPHTVNINNIFKQRCCPPPKLQLLKSSCFLITELHKRTVLINSGQHAMMY